MSDESAGVGPITLACLDMAGTTVDDGDAVLDAFRTALLASGEGLDLEAAERHVRATMGQSKLDVFRELLGGDHGRAERANADFEEAYGAVVAAGGVRAMDGADELFGSLRAAGVRICLTTGFSPATRDVILHALGWDGVADLVVSPVDAGRGRPYPDMILSAVLRLGVDDVRHVAVAGDTASDLVAGTRAGASIVAGVLTGAHDRPILEAAPHTHLLDSVVDLGPLVGAV